MNKLTYMPRPRYLSDCDLFVAVNL